MTFLEGGGIVNEVPWLRRGTGDTPADGGCIMQVIDWVSTNGWTDQPECVHPVIRKAAIAANDELADEYRQKLLDLAPRLMGTNTGGYELTVRLAVWCARRVLRVFEEAVPGDRRPRQAIEAAEAWLNGGGIVGSPIGDHALTAAGNYGGVLSSSPAAWAARAACHAADSAYVSADRTPGGIASLSATGAAYAHGNFYVFLVELLDEYDRLTGRTKTAACDLSSAARAMAGAV